MVRCKMRLCSITRQGNPEFQTLTFAPQYSDEPGSENKKFWDATPGGELKLNCVNPAVLEELGGRLNQEFYIDISPALAKVAE